MSKILLITDNAYTYTGREKICDFMVSSFSGKNNVVDVFSCKGSGEPFYAYSGVNCIKSFENSKWPLLDIVNSINESSYDYIFVVSMGKLSVFFALLSFRIKKVNLKKISCEHISLDSLKWYVRVLKRIMLKKYDKVIVLTERDKNVLVEWGIKADVIENPIDYKNFFRKKRCYKAVAIGRLNKQKNFCELIKIWGLFIKENPQWTLNILGDGEEMESLSSEIKKRELEGCIFLRGRVSNVHDYYMDSDICLMTSVYEGLPMALLEAKSYSLPAVAYDCPTGPKEIIEDGIDGFVVQLHNQSEFVYKMNTLANDDELFYSFSSATLKTALRFDSANINKKWCALILN
ncbi:glycosyltransferase [Klebsiella sp. RHBSTW-00484]|uniref:glycosyltransferase n=1 Tax=unclassified Klebsiella TaxID=2608929 RepID=UPI0015E4B097|nr:MULTISPECIES: glycosyltransferase [unclassified Klebsiella]QLO36246.1 glycosyltransferase [Klebsiella sp. RHBSTW-00484]QLT75763.1 glycosyltransferase [Klebsiella sp. RHBSTW-00464]